LFNTILRIRIRGAGCVVLVCLQLTFQLVHSREIVFKLTVEANEIKDWSNTSWNIESAPNLELFDSHFTMFQGHAIWFIWKPSRGKGAIDVLYMY
jgi:hypothetical protein